MKKKSKKILITSVIVIVLLILTFLCYYFINSYNKTRVYSIHTKDDTFQNGIFITTNESWFLNLGRIGINKEIKKLELYLDINDQKEFISTYSPGELLMENNGYDELFRYNEKDTINNMYVRLTYMDNTVEEKKLSFQLEYDNKKIVMEKAISINKPITDKEKTELPVSSKKLIELLEKNGELVDVTFDKNKTYQYKFTFGETKAWATYRNYIPIVEIKSYDGTFIDKRLNDIYMSYNDSKGNHCIIITDKEYQTTTRNYKKCIKEECEGQDCVECNPPVYCSKEAEREAYELYNAFLKSLKN